MGYAEMSRCAVELEWQIWNLRDAFGLLEASPSTYKSFYEVLVILGGRAITWYIEGWFRGEVCVFFQHVEIFGEGSY